MQRNLPGKKPADHHATRASDCTNSTEKSASDTKQVVKRKRYNEHERLNRCRERNRIHAKNTRERKRQQADVLQQKIAKLIYEKIRLKNLVPDSSIADILISLSAGLQETTPTSVLHPIDAESHSFLVSESSKYVIEIMENLKLNIASNISVEDIEDEKEGATTVLSTVGKDRNKFTMEDLNNIRRERNRRHAKKTRFRKKIMLAQIELIISGLEKEVLQLRKDSNLIGVDLFGSAGLQSNVNPNFSSLFSRGADDSFTYEIDDDDDQNGDKDGDSGDEQTESTPSSSASSTSQHMNQATKLKQSASIQTTEITSQDEPEGADSDSDQSSDAHTAGGKSHRKKIRHSNALPSILESTSTRSSRVKSTTTKADSGSPMNSILGSERQSCDLQPLNNTKDHAKLVPINYQDYNATEIQELYQSILMEETLDEVAGQNDAHPSADKQQIRQEDTERRELARRITAAKQETNGARRSSVNFDLDDRKRETESTNSGCTVTSRSRSVDDSSTGSAGSGSDNCGSTKNSSVRSGNTDSEMGSTSSSTKHHQQAQSMTSGHHLGECGKPMNSISDEATYDGPKTQKKLFLDRHASLESLEFKSNGTDQ